MSTTGETRAVKARVKGQTGYTPVHRPSIYGNPYPVSEHGRAESVRLYRVYLEERCATDPAFRAAVLALRGKALGCMCPQEAIDAGECHACVLAEWIEAQPVYETLSLF